MLEKKIGRMVKKGLGVSLMGAMLTIGAAGSADYAIAKEKPTVYVLGIPVNSGLSGREREKLMESNSIENQYKIMGGKDYGSTYGSMSGAGNGNVPMIKIFEIKW